MPRISKNAPLRPFYATFESCRLLQQSIKTPDTSKITLELTQESTMHQHFTWPLNRGPSSSIKLPSPTSSPDTSLSVLLNLQEFGVPDLA
jgi:hypothetical protein